MKPVTLEVREEAAAKAAVQIAMDTYGRLDVLVNNAALISVPQTVKKNSFVLVPRRLALA